ncbi:LacI family DNA-binding transcriptional regulator [Nonomuraea sediminis]|uniref:LacI family DNA-binding transcriptional regulator n=1 Tax=Nonomuraea sediminis TaxID=2835864 RepID=UPI001BDBF5AA|nr:LacI family DNA-binding transcriptional regulator [Nonomuraea sediminis]
MGRRVTSVDVAREAGVSRATVSYVLNDVSTQKIPESTRERVLAAAERLGYAPSAAARALRAGRSDVVLCLLPDWPIGPTAGEFLDHMSTALADYGLTFMVHPRGRHARPITEVWKAITPCAVIAYEDFDEAELAAMRAAGVLATHVIPGTAKARAKAVDQVRIGRMQAEYLHGRGHRRLGYAFYPDERLTDLCRPRLEGVQQACASLGLPEPLVVDVPLNAAAAARAVDRWKGEVTAVCCYNDETAFAVLAGMRERGLSAPADLAVIGVDDIPTAPLSAPPLTTIRTDHDTTASRVVDRLLSLMSGETPPSPTPPVSIRLIHRESA